MDWETGDVIWKEDLGIGSPLLVNGKFILLSDRGELRIAEATPKGFNLLSSTSLPYNVYFTHPVLLRGRIFVRNRKGDLYCIDVSK